MTATVGRQFGWRQPEAGVTAITSAAVLVSLVCVALCARRFWRIGDNQAWPTNSAEV